ncbi:CalY family protein [Virgibacillus salexigens]|uniref:CalY family protein n=1 Tax=Virgibacillus salexigens TaxID=61016 RepID=UPI001F3E44C8|nr:CalY family protein [Virgibacillus salexigens]
MLVTDALFLYNTDKFDEVVFETTLAELKNMSPESVNENIFYPEFGEQGLEAGIVDDLTVKLNFVDNSVNQNQYQGESLQLNWTFNTEQGEGRGK